MTSEDEREHQCQRPRRRERIDDVIDGRWVDTNSIAKPHAITCSNFRKKKKGKVSTLAGQERGGEENTVTQKYVLSVHPYEGTNERELDCRGPLKLGSIRSIGGMGIKDLPEHGSWLILYYSCLGLQGRWPESWGGEINVTRLNPSLRSVIHQRQKTEFYSFVFLFSFFFSFFPLSKACVHVAYLYIHIALIQLLSPHPLPFSDPFRQIWLQVHTERERGVYRYVCTYGLLACGHWLHKELYPWIVGSDE